MEVVSGEIKGIRVADKDNGYLVADIKTDEDKMMAVVGTLFEPHIGFNYEFTGGWENSKWGWQFKFAHCRLNKPDNESSLVEYLKEYATWIGPKRAKLIYAAYGKDSLTILKNDPERVVKDISGITMDRAKELSEKLLVMEDMENVLIGLNTLAGIMGLSNRAKSFILKMWGEHCVEAMRENPYGLIDEVPGVGFLSADKLGLYLNGGNSFDPERVKAAILYILQEDAFGQGNICMPVESYYKRTARLLGHIGPEYVYTSTQALITEEDILAVGDYVYLKKYYDQEQLIRRVLVAKASTEFIAATRLVTEGLGADQAEALEAISTNGVFVLTGAPGTGKTFLLKRILQAFPGADFALAAPTGKAAKRMTEQTGSPAMTIHRLLEPQPTLSGFVFTRNAENPIDADIIILDEMSMVDVPLMASFLDAVSKSAKLILVGDHHQLPPVGPGSVLLDAIRSTVIPTTELTQIKRQEEETGDIIKNCHRIKNGQDIIANVEDTATISGSDFYVVNLQAEEAIRDHIIHLVSKQLPRQFPDLDPLVDIQVITPHRQKHSLSCDGLNPVLQAAINRGEQCGSSIFRVGDKVIQTKNDYKLEIINGDIGIILDYEKKEMTVKFDNPDRELALDIYDNELQLAYALTVHKFQGSEAPVIVIPIHSDFSQHLLHRNLLYTAISRAQKLCILVGHMNIIPAIISRQQKPRHTNLASYLYNDLR